MIVRRLVELLYGVVIMVCASSVEPDTYSTQSINTVSETGSYYVDMNVTLDDGEKVADLESKDILIDCENGVAYVKALTIEDNLWFSEGNSYDSVEVFQDGTNGFMYQCNNNGEWGRSECEPFSVTSSVYDFGFSSMCGSGWSVEDETVEEIHLSRDIGSILGSGYFQDNYTFVFGMFGDTRFDDCSSVAVIDKKSKRLKSYDETVWFYADELNGVPEYTVDDGKTEVGVHRYSCTVHIGIDTISGVKIPDSLANSFNKDTVEIAGKVKGLVVSDFIVTDSSFDSNIIEE